MMKGVSCLFIFLFFIFLFLCLFIFLLLLSGYTDCTDLGSGFSYYDDNKHILGKIDIPPTIISYDYDDDFIVAKQKPQEFNYAIYNKRDYIYPLGRDTVYYWLIIKESQQVIGALDYDSFQELKKKYKVPDKLLLE